MIHTVKTEDRWLDRVVDGVKTCEVRFNDRDYQAGDTLRLVSIENEDCTVDRRITHVLPLGLVPGLSGFGLSGWAVLSLGPVL